MHDEHVPAAALSSEEKDIGAGHNHPPRTAQWQTLHGPEGSDVRVREQAEPDLDLVERSFVEGFLTSSDPTSFLRLAGVPFTGHDKTGKTLSLLRVKVEQTTDVGAVMPHLGGQSYRYDPLPSKMISERRELAFVYHDGEGLQALSFDQARQLEPDG